MIVVGVDPGKKGAVAVYNTTADSIDIFDIPLDENRDLDAISFYTWLVARNPQYTLIEDVWTPKTLVLMAGEIAAVAKLAGATVERITVVEWKKAMIGHNSSDKAESVALCKKLRPKVDLMLTARSKTPSADRAEAVLLALYAAKICPLAENSSK